MPGRNQWIVIVGGLVVLGIGLGSLFWLDLDAAKEFLNFAGSFGWKVITGALGGSALIKAATALKK